MIKDQPTLWQKCLIALVAALVTFSKQIGFFLVSENRYYLHWEVTDSLALILGVMILAALGLGVSVVLKALKWDRMRHVYNHVSVLLLANGLLTLVPPRYAPQLRQTRLGLLMWSAVWLAVLGTIVFSFFNRRFPLVRYSGNFCLLFSPLVPILFYQTATMKTWSSAKESHADLTPPVPASSSSTPGKTPIFIFVFDEWSYPRSTQNDEFLPELVNLRRLAQQSCFFRNAWSFAPLTLHSLPAMIFQTDRHIRIGRRSVSLVAQGKSAPAAETPSIFSLAKECGYVTALEGFYHPYGKLVGRHLDYCRAFSVYPTPSRLWGKVWFDFTQNLFWFTDPLTATARRRFTAAQQGRNFYDLNNSIREETLRLLKNCPANTLAFIHVPLPHGPFVFNADGSYHGPFAGNPVIGSKPTVDDYRRHLLYLDRVIAEIVADLKAAGKFDDAMLVITSDHGWREDPQETVQPPTANPLVRKVPFVIKFPGQQQPQTSDKTIYNHLHLRPIIERAMRDKVDARSASELIKSLEKLPPPAGKFSAPSVDLPKENGNGLISNE